MCVISQNATVIGQTADGHLQGVAERARPESLVLGDAVQSQLVPGGSGAGAPASERH